MRTRRQISVVENDLSYAAIEPLEQRIPAQRQAAKRHYGVHPYFTRRPFNVVRDYIAQYSREGDVVLDPFGGSGVTAIEAYLENRVGIQNDINPLANFIARGIADLSKGNLEDYNHALGELKDKCQHQLAQIGNMDESVLLSMCGQLPLPPNVRLPSNSDVEHYYDLFTMRQLVSLAILRQGIDALRSEYPRNAMLLAWSATLTKLNKTFLSAEGRTESRGGSSIFSIYRYKIARMPVELPPWQTFEERAKNVLAAKIEIDRIIELKRQTGSWHGSFEVYSDDIVDLEKRFPDQIDYIFTDPPYGGHISYLDLSTLWNVWLGQVPTHNARLSELIVGGEVNHDESSYIRRLGQSIRSCVNMLKSERWLSVVFQHWNVAYFDAILTSAAEAGAELKAAISQVGDPIWSMHKKKRNESVLAGELILTFYKSGKRHQARRTGGLDVSKLVGEILATSPPQIYGESLFNQIILEAWHRSAIQALDISKTEFTEIIRRHGWHYDEKNHYWIRNSSRKQSLFN